MFCSESLIRGSHLFSIKNWATSTCRNSQAQMRLVQPPSSATSDRIIKKRFFSTEKNFKIQLNEKKLYYLPTKVLGTLHSLKIVLHVSK